MKRIGYILGLVMMVSSAFAMTSNTIRGCAREDLLNKQKEILEIISSAKVVTPTIIIMQKFNDFITRSLEFDAEFPNEVLKKLSKEEYTQYENRMKALELELELLCDISDKINETEKQEEAIKVEKPEEKNPTFLDELFPYVKSAVMSEIAMGLVKFAMGGWGSMFNPGKKAPIKVDSHPKLAEGMNMVTSAPVIKMKGGIPRGLRTFMKVENIKAGVK